MLDRLSTRRPYCCLRRTHPCPATARASWSTAPRLGGAIQKKPAKPLKSPCCPWPLAPSFVEASAKDSKDIIEKAGREDEDLRASRYSFQAKVHIAPATDWQHTIPNTQSKHPAEKLCVVIRGSFAERSSARFGPVPRAAEGDRLLIYVGQGGRDSHT